MPAETKPSPHNSLLLWLSALALAACTDSTEPLPSARMTLEPYLVPCEGEGSMSCMMIRDADSGQTGRFYGDIEGFHFEWGYRQTLQVERRNIPDPSADGPSIEYTLVKTLERKSDKNWGFRAVLTDSSALRLSGDTLFIRGYARPILVGPENRVNLKGKDIAYCDLWIRADLEDSAGALLGDSARVLHPDSTGRLVPE